MKDETEETKDASRSQHSASRHSYANRHDLSWDQNVLTNNIGASGFKDIECSC